MRLLRAFLAYVFSGILFVACGGEPAGPMHEELGSVQQGIDVSTTPVTVSGQINQGGDRYRHVVDIMYGSSCTFETTLGTLPDSVMWLYDVNLSLLQFDDDSGPGLGSMIQRSLPSGRYYVDVGGYSASQTGTYTMTIACGEASRVELYRYYNTRNYDHFYTTYWSELGPGGGDWRYEGIAGYVHSQQAAGTVPFYRYANTRTGDHFYTRYWSELGPGGGDWRYEGIVSYIYPDQVAGTVPFYRYANTRNGGHFYTTYWSELGSGGGDWRYEGIAGFIAAP